MAEKKDSKERRRHKKKKKRLDKNRPRVQLELKDALVQVLAVLMCQQFSSYSADQAATSLAAPVPDSAVNTTVSEVPQETACTKLQSEHAPACIRAHSSPDTFSTTTLDPSTETSLSNVQPFLLTLDVDDGSMIKMTNKHTASYSKTLTPRSLERLKARTVKSAVARSMQTPSLQIQALDLHSSRHHGHGHAHRHSGHSHHSAKPRELPLTSNALFPSVISASQVSIDTSMKGSLSYAQVASPKVVADDSLHHRHRMHRSRSFAALSAIAQSEEERASFVPVAMQASSADNSTEFASQAASPALPTLLNERLDASFIPGARKTMHKKTSQARTALSQYSTPSDADLLTLSKEVQQTKLFTVVVSPSTNESATVLDYSSFPIHPSKISQTSSDSSFPAPPSEAQSSSNPSDRFATADSRVTSENDPGTPKTGTVAALSASFEARIQVISLMPF